VIEKNFSFEVFNTNARDAKKRDILFDIEKDTFNKQNLKLKKDEYICICSGGTTSSCSRNNFITLDLRRKYNHINFNKETNIVTVGGGVIMNNLLNHLDKYNRIFPIGLSNLPGMGYVLTGGVSPLSRRYGLAIDNIEFIKGYLGNGKYFSLYRKNLNNEDKSLWEALRGAAPFLSIVTEVGLKTIRNYPIFIWEGFLNEIELIDIIEMAEGFPENMSLQWISTDKIYIYIVAEIKTESDKIKIKEYLQVLNKFTSLTTVNFKSLKEISFFPKELDLFELNSTYHSEVISLLGEDLNNNVSQFVEIINDINKSKPNKSCYVACQQLGGNTKKLNSYPSLFIHTNSSWKPWIFASWERDNIRDKEISLNWMNESWCKLKKLFPNIHLAQLHNHLQTHDEEVTRAFDRKIDKLKDLKNFCDPSGILPPL